MAKNATDGPMFVSWDISPNYPCSLGPSAWESPAYHGLLEPTDRGR